MLHLLFDGVPFPLDPPPGTELPPPTHFDEVCSFLVLDLFLLSLISFFLPRRWFVALFKIAFPWMPNRFGQENRGLVHEGGTRYPGVKGKVVEFADHGFAEGRLYIRVRFQDESELGWQVDCAATLREADLSDWKTGDRKHIRTFIRSERDGEV